MSHRFVSPLELPEAIGFSHVAVPARGQHIYLAGQSGHRADGTIDIGLLAQFAQACRNVSAALEAVGAAPGDVVSMNIYVIDVASYRGLRSELGQAYREVFGHHYPPMALLGVGELFDPDAVVELVAVAVIPAPRTDS